MPALTREEMNRALTTEQRNALVLVARWRDQPNGRERAAQQLNLTDVELSTLLAEARRRLERAAERKAAARPAPAAAVGAERNGDVAAWERDRLRRGLPPRRSNGEAAARRTPTGKRPKGMRAAEFRGTLVDGDRTQAEVRKLIGVGGPESKRLKDQLVQAGHVVETGEVRGRSPVLHLTDVGRRGEAIRFEAGTGQRDERDAAVSAASDGSTHRPVAADTGGEPEAAARPVSDQPAFARDHGRDYVIADGATVCPLCGGTLR